MAFPNGEELAKHKIFVIYAYNLHVHTPILYIVLVHPPYIVLVVILLVRYVMVQM